MERVCGRTFVSSRPASLLHLLEMMGEVGERGETHGVLLTESRVEGGTHDLPSDAAGSIEVGLAGLAPGLGNI
jgi:hypothetical protein